ncbi:MAG: hypothetical protein KatS3mg089_0028 [Patescibacteria group bacterium]|nr:MAG: hypothetical protein KatS3mg089_0028 [Patescibacteria group bacterium]
MKVFYHLILPIIGSILVLFLFFVNTQVIDAYHIQDCSRTVTGPNGSVLCCTYDTDLGDGTGGPAALCNPPSGGDGSYNGPYTGDGSYDGPYNGSYLPDFRVTSVGARNRNGNTQSYFVADSPTYNIDGDPIYVTVDILNDGNGYPDSSSRHAVYKDVDAYNSGSASMYIDSSNNWPPGFTATYQSWPGGVRSDQFTSPFFTQRNAGRYRVYVKANYNNAVSEWNYSNNTGSSAIYEVRSSIFGWVCWSKNEDAQCDDASGSTPADPLVSNIRITLYKDNNNNYGTLVATDTTVQTSNWNRSYAFDNLSAGDYLVRWDDPDWLPISSQARTATLGPHTRIRFAVKPAYRLWGYVFVDNDRDGVRDSDETVGYSGVSVSLSGTESRTTTTDARWDV